MCCKYLGYAWCALMLSRVHSTYGGARGGWCSSPSASYWDAFTEADQQLAWWQLTLRMQGSQVEVSHMYTHLIIVVALKALEILLTRCQEVLPGLTLLGL